MTSPNNNVTYKTNQIVKVYYSPSIQPKPNMFLAFCNLFHYSNQTKLVSDRGAQIIFFYDYIHKHTWIFFGTSVQFTSFPDFVFCPQLSPCLKTYFIVTIYLHSRTYVVSFLTLFRGLFFYMIWHDRLQYNNNTKRKG